MKVIVPQLRKGQVENSSPPCLDRCYVRHRIDWHKNIMGRV